MNIEAIAGRWVLDKDLPPDFNILGRDWMTADGEMHGNYTYVGSIPLEAHCKGVLWHLPWR